MRTCTVYSSRNNSDGSQPENKMFWNTCVRSNEDFSSELKLMESAHADLYRDIVKGKKGMLISEHPAFVRLKNILESVYEQNGCVIFEMFLYSAKAVPNLLPSDNVDRNHDGKDITTMYTLMLAKLMDRSIQEYSEKKSNYGNPSINGYVHVLKSWPRTGTWNEIQRLAIRVYGQMKETSSKVEEQLFDALGKVYNYQSAFEVLICAEKRNHSEERLLTLLKFTCTKYNGQNGIRCTESMCRQFGRVIECLYEDGSPLYDKLLDLYQEMKIDGLSIRCLNEVFGLTEDDPLKDVYDRTEDEIAKYIFEHYDPPSFSWRRWLENLDNEFYWNAVKDRFEQIIYPSGYIKNVAFMLCSFAGMHKLEHGRNYVKKINKDSGFQFAQGTPALDCILLCARQLSGEMITITDILEQYERLEEDEFQAVQNTVRLLIKGEKNRKETQKYIQNRVDKINDNEENDIIYLLDWISKYYQFKNDKELSQSIIPTRIIMNMIERACGFERNRKMFAFSPSTALLLVSMNYIADDITWENKKIYEGFLQAACKTCIRNRAEKLLIEYFSSDING